MARRLGRILMAFMVVGAVLGVTTHYLRDRPVPARAPSPRAAPAGLAADAVRVVDGDSLELGGQRVRLKGIDALELHQTCRDAGGAGIACGQEARAALAALVADGPVRCSDEGTDRFGRTLARCKNGRGEEINRALVREGWALAFAGDPRYAAEERAARQARRGIHAWAFVPPAEWRRGQR